VPKTVQTPRPTAAALSVVPTSRSSSPPFVLDEAEPGRRLVLRGRLGVTSATDTRLALAAAVAGGTGDLVLDLSELQQVDATGLGVLVGAHRAAGRAGRTLVLQDVPPQVERLLFVTRLYRVIRTARTSSCA
jgi:anti-anti-sigma factor